MPSPNIKGAPGAGGKKREFFEPKIRVKKFAMVFVVCGALCSGVVAWPRIVAAVRHLGQAYK